MEHVDSREHPWASNREDVARRWQHAIEVAGTIAQQHSHPLLSHGEGWVDQAHTARVLEPIDFRSIEASFVENALILVHSLVLYQFEVGEQGLSVRLNTSNSPEWSEYDIHFIDLRDMSEPTDTVIGNMTVEQYVALSEAERTLLQDTLQQRLQRDRFSTLIGFAWPPQQARYYKEMRQLESYALRAEFGTDNNEEIYTIRDQLRAHEVAQIRREQPNFGIQPDTLEALSDDDLDAICSIFEYFDQTRDPFDENPHIDEYSLGRMGYESTDMESLVTDGILIDNGLVFDISGYLQSYTLSQPYYEYWVSRHYPDADEEEVIEL